MDRIIWLSKGFSIFLMPFLLLLWSAAVFAEASIEVSFIPDKIKQGDICIITIKTNPAKYKITGNIFDKPVHFYRNPDSNVYSALIGIDLNTEPDIYNISLSFENENGETIKKEYEIIVSSADFGTQKLTLPKEKVDLDEETLKRVKNEEEKVASVWDIFTERHLWTGNFITPVDGELSSDFGLRRIINDEPRNPHTGVDITSSEGTPVYASNHGKVVLIDDHFFSGKSLFIDHGLGLFSMYFHLSEILVNNGDVINKGQLIAKVGKSGRATGPHLHWGIRLNNARVNPASLLNLQLEEKK